MSQEQNLNTIKKFYNAFADRDGDTMATCYHEEVTFNDPAFVNLKGEEASGMWKMLLSRSTTLQVTFNSEWANDNEGGAKWEAKYEYGPSKRKVHNKIEANFKFKDGLIIEHVDTFDFWKWSRMALGAPGLILGGTPFLKKKVQSRVRKLLDKYMAEDSGH